MPLLVDTGVLYALADADDDWHQPVREYLTRAPDVLLVPVTVLPEVTYLLHKRLGSGAERAFVESLASGELTVEPLKPRDFTRCGELLAEYGAIGFVDASVVAIAERLGLKTLATTDRRHFSRIRPKHVESFELVP